ncbi:DUF3611 family protein [Alkalinema sp. FACHB-956]|uniref:DUF3611 family protein n=1 Tax=Alkalinema sp. FACHB-956 TaxID=2692768 RepID=UPI001689EAA4|nr:DUF3611 family protein [Alkalinema sp. FACHB-956]MBD2327155.1 DUF3611 family protein [Alkalinema sp. FACHB-956]
MTSQLDNSPAPPNLKQIAKTFRLVGWVSFWAQLVLAIISGLIFIFAVLSAAAFSRSATPGASAANPGTGGGIFFATCSLFVLAYCIYRSFQYVQLGRRLQETNPSFRPKKSETVQFLWRSLLVRGVGLLLAVMAAEAITGVLLGKAFLSMGAIFNPLAINQIIQPLDIFLVLANTHLITAHFIGSAASLWLLNRINR